MKRFCEFTALLEQDTLFAVHPDTGKVHFSSEKYHDRWLGNDPAFKEPLTRKNGFDKLHRGRVRTDAIGGGLVSHHYIPTMSSDAPDKVGSEVSKHFHIPANKLNHEFIGI